LDKAFIAQKLQSNKAYFSLKNNDYIKAKIVCLINLSLLKQAFLKVLKHHDFARKFKIFILTKENLPYFQ